MQNKPITPQEMNKWIDETWKKCQDEAWERTKEKLAEPETLAVLKRMKNR